MPKNTVLCLIAFVRYSLTSAETKNNKIQREALGILHGLEKCHHYHFVHEVSMITDYKPLAAIFEKMWQPVTKGTMDPAAYAS